MRYKFLPMLFLALPACIGISRTVDMAPAEESAGFEFPLLLPAEGARRLEGNMAAAIQLAMDDFLPWDATPPPEVRPERRCLYQRESYNVTAAPAPDGIVLVRFTIDGESCPPDPKLSRDASTGLPLAEVTTYAVDVRTLRVLAIDMRMEPWGRQ